MDGLSGFLEMGGYAAFVWPSYALTAVVMVALVVGTLRELRARQRRLHELEAARPSRRRKSESAAP